MSAQFLVRMPPTLHDQLKRRAKHEGVSLNQLIVALLAGGIGFKLDSRSTETDRRKRHAARSRPRTGASDG